MPVVIQVSTLKYAIQHVYDCRQQTTAESLEGAMFHPVSLLEPASHTAGTLDSPKEV